MIEMLLPLCDRAVRCSQLVRELERMSDEHRHFLLITRLACPVKGFAPTVRELAERGDASYVLSAHRSVTLLRREDVRLQDDELGLRVSGDDRYKCVLFEEDARLVNPINYEIVVGAEPKEDEYLQLLQTYTHRYVGIYDKGVPYKLSKRLVAERMRDRKAMALVLLVRQDNLSDLLSSDLSTTYRHMRFLVLLDSLDEEQTVRVGLYLQGVKEGRVQLVTCFPGSLRAAHQLLLRELVYFEHVVLMSDFAKRAPTGFMSQASKFHDFKAVVRLDGLTSVRAREWAALDLPDDAVDSVQFREAVESRAFATNHESCWPASTETTTEIVSDDDGCMERWMTIKDYDALTSRVDALIAKNRDPKRVPDLYSKKISMYFLTGKDDRQVERELKTLIAGSTDLDFLSTLALLVSQLPKAELIKEALYERIVARSMEAEITNVTLMCVKQLLWMPKVAQDTLSTTMRMVRHIRDKRFVKEADYGQLLRAVFVQMLRNGYTDLHAEFDELVGSATTAPIPQALTDAADVPEFVYYVATHLNAYLESHHAIEKRRQDIDRNLDDLIAHYKKQHTLEDVVLLPVSNFYLSYHGMSNAGLFVKKSRFLRGVCPDLSYVAPHLATLETRKMNDRPLRVCFHSTFLCRNHSVHKDRHQVICRLAEDPRLEVYFSTFDDLQDAVRFKYGRAKHVLLKRELDQARDALSALELDALVFCEIGMCSTSYFLAHMRFAPLQVNTWGHSDTSGISTIDYFVSSRLFEDSDAQENYSERLHLMPSLSTCYVNPMARYSVNTFKPRLSYGFTQEVKVFFCAQSLFKFHPAFDACITGILTAVPDAVLLIHDGGDKQAVLRRFEGQGITARIHVLPMTSHHGFMNLMQISDVVLDPYPFGGCNSSMEAFALGKPVVSRRGPLINGRFTAGFYAAMDMEDVLASDTKDYVHKAIRLATDQDYYSSVQERIVRNRSRLYEQEQAVEDWARFLVEKIEGCAPCSAIVEDQPVQT